MSPLTIVVGLPGSGKTFFLDEFRSAGGYVFDDYKNRSLDNTSAFGSSRFFVELLGRLKEGSDCVISDIDFCKTRAREEAIQVLARHMPDVVITWRFYQNDPQQCETNVRSRARPSLEADLAAIRRYSPDYLIPQNAGPYPVWRP